MRTQHSLVLNKNTQNPDMGQLLWGLGANWTAHLHSANDTSEHGTQESSYHGTLTQNTALDESWRNTVGSGDISPHQCWVTHKRSSFTNCRSWE